jgi:divalent metal cation (Fe/Co/Zn/Cd) transporter
METLFDLPAHVLFVHAPVVLTPLVTLACLAVLLRPAWRHRYGWPLVVACGVVLVATMLAVQSGEEFAEALAGAVPVAKHQDLAETTRLLVLVQFVLALGVVLVQRRFARVLAGVGSGGGGASTTTPPANATIAGQPAVVVLLTAALAVVSVLATVWMIRTGHEGARITWSGVLD